MSYHVFFSFSTGLAKAISVPKGTKQSYIKHIEEIEAVLGLKREKYKDNPIHWDGFKRDFSGIPDNVLCDAVESHNAWIIKAYEDLAYWAKHPFTVGEGHKGKGPNAAYPIGWESETITPKDAQLFWHGFEALSVPPRRWTREYYVHRMEHLYDVMRGNTSEGVSFDEKALTPRQAAQVINIFSTYLDRHDMRLDVPKDHDYLASSYDGGYEWCEKCGAVTPSDANSCTKRKCPIRDENE